MHIDKDAVDSFNGSRIASQERKFSRLKEDLADIGADAELIVAQLQDFQVAIPSWALGTGGTRFGRFAGGGEPGSQEQKIDDIGLLHALHRRSVAMSLHLPWAIPADPALLKTVAELHGIRFVALNYNLFHDHHKHTLTYKY